MFILLNWIWLEGLRFPTIESICDPANNSLSPDINTTSDEDEENVIPEITHLVVFKCIGAHKERQYQEILALASQKLKENSKIKLNSNLSQITDMIPRLLLSCVKLTTRVVLELAM